MTREEMEMRKLVRESDVIDKTDGTELARAFNHLWNKYIEREPVIDRIRAEIDQYLFQNEFGLEYRKEVSQIIDKYKAESEG